MFLYVYVLSTHTHTHISIYIIRLEVRFYTNIKTIYAGAANFSQKWRPQNI